MISVTGLDHSTSISHSSNLASPWVTVVCTCYNHQDYVVETLQSVIDQDYPNVELIVIDNGSTDRSAERITAFIKLYSGIQFICNAVNLGLNKAFNSGLALAGGRYLIDLSADDVLLPGRVSKQVATFEQLPDSYGVVFSNAAYIDATGQQTGIHYAIVANGRANSVIPTGDVFLPILTSYFICTPTMMMRREVMIELGGYDETLAFEDFDFWVRSARQYHYAYVDEVLTLKRQLPNSLSAQVVLPNNTLLQSTLTVCYKAYERCASPDEYKALAERIRSFLRKAFYAEQFDLALHFGTLLRQIEKPGLGSNLILEFCRLHIPVNALYRLYLKWQARH